MVFRPSVIPRTIALTVLALLAFAANSVLCRLALGQHLIDAASFTTVRAISGAALLGGLTLLRPAAQEPSAAGLRSAAMLFTYMVFFSFAYLYLGAGTGALILFASVQLTMFTVALRAGERFSPLSWAGFALAALGLVYLVSPGLTAPDPVGALLMIIAGIAWDFTLCSAGEPGTRSRPPRGISSTWSPPVLIVSVLFASRFMVTPGGVALAVASGAVASGCGYVIWYAALAGLTATRAATVQLAVPAIAALGGVLLLSEPLTPRLLLASAITLGGIAIVLAQRAHRARV